jgi:hypothetical protein
VFHDVYLNLLFNDLQSYIFQAWRPAPILSIFTRATSFSASARFVRFEVHGAGFGLLKSAFCPSSRRGRRSEGTGEN